MTKSLSKVSGFTLLELVLTIGITATVLMVAAPFFTLPTRMMKTSNFTDRESALAHSVEMMMTDLREADPSSVSWASIPATGSPFGFTKTTYDVLFPTASVTSSFVFSVVPDTAAGSANFVRDQDGIRQVLLKGVQMPTATFPLVFQDTTTFHLLVIQLASSEPDGKTARVIRRFAVRG